MTMLKRLIVSVLVSMASLAAFAGITLVLAHVPHAQIVFVSLVVVVAWSSVVYAIIYRD